MKVHHLIPIFMLVLIRPGVSQPDDSWEVDLKNVGIREFVNRVSLITGKTFVVDPQIRDRITIASNVSMDKEAIYELFLKVLRVHGLAALASGKTTKIAPQLFPNPGSNPEDFMTFKGSLDNRWRDLGITADMLQTYRMPEQQEAVNLVDAGQDMFERPQQMTHDTFNHWRRMQLAAQQDGIRLLLVSAYRSVDYQFELFQRKLEAGQQIGDIMAVNTVPGFSEHHTGCAIDLHDGVGKPLTESFEDTQAFHWLTTKAGRFGFVMSYPRDNPHGINYEPWHWCYRH